MQRIEIGARPDWKERVEGLGLDYHTTSGKPYWADGTYYHFSPAEIDLLEEATKLTRRRKPERRELATKAQAVVTMLKMVEPRWV